MNKYKLHRVVPFVLISSIMLSGCGKKSECDLPTRHVHLYTKNVSHNINISRYIQDEHLERNGYNWNEEYMEITKKDEAFYKLLNSKGLFNALDNWDYLYDEMYYDHDWLEFYYHYTTTEVEGYYDSDGDYHTRLKTKTHNGWSRDPYHHGNTGKVRVCHHKYFSYCVNYENNKFSLKKSHLVDDIRKVIQQYPYVGEDNSEIVHKEYNMPFNFKLGKLNVEDLDEFTQPDLENTTPYLGYSK